MSASAENAASAASLPPAATAARRRLAIFCSIVLLLVAVAALAPLVATHDPNAAVLSDALRPPSVEHWFGTDKMGRDLFSRVVYGARLSISSSLVLVFGILLVGGTLGTLAGFFGRALDSVIMRVADMMVSFPGMALAIALAGILGPSITNAILAIMAVSWTKYARLARSIVMRARGSDYVSAARLAGTRELAILVRYMVPEVAPTLAVTAATDVGGMMLELAGLSFLGLGAQSTSIEWGYMLNEGRSVMESAPWMMVFPGAAIFVTVVAFNLVGDALRDVLDPRAQVVPRRRQTRRRTVGRAVAGEAPAAGSSRGPRRVIAPIAAVLAVAVVASLALGGLRGAGAGGSAPSHLNFGCYNYSDSLDPATNVNSSWCGTRYAVTECLFRFDSEVVAQPNLVDSYDHSEGYRTWTLHLRDGVAFSNGRPVTASAVKASIERLYDETDASRGGTGNSNPEVYLARPIIAADDASGTVTLTCQEPTGNLPGILAYPYFSIIDVEEAARDSIVGTGPYAVSRFDKGSSLELVRNGYYWGGEVPYDTVTVLFVDDSSTKAMALRSGDVDVVENVTTASDLAKLEADPAFEVDTAAGVRTGNSYLNMRGPLGNKALRQAVMQAIDSETMCAKTVSGMYTAGFSVLPSSLSYGYDQLTNPYPYDPDAARRRLDEAGIVDTDGNGIRELDGKDLDLRYVAYSSRNLNEFAEAVALSLKAVGIGCTVSVTDYDTALGLQNAGEFDLITANTTTVGTGDPQDFLGGWYSGNSKSYGFYNNPAYDALYERLERELDTEARRELIVEMQQTLVDDAATIVHGYYNSRMFSRADRVTGAGISTIDYYWLTTDIRPAG